MPRHLLILASALCAVTSSSAFILPAANSGIPMGAAASPASTAIITSALSTTGAFTRIPLRWELQSTTDGQTSSAATTGMEGGAGAGEEEDKDSLKGWQICWEDINTLPTEENSQTPLILRSTTDTSYLKDRFFVLIRHQGGVKLVDASCGRCGFPLINGPIVQEPRLEEEDNTAITCKVCGMRHSISTGKAMRPKSATLNLGQNIGNIFFKKGETKDIDVHPTRVMPDGKIYAKIGALKVKRPTTDMLVL